MNRYAFCLLFLVNFHSSFSMEQSLVLPLARELRLQEYLKEQGGNELHFAAKYNLGDRAQELVNLKTDINVFDKQGNTPLLIASQEGHTNIVQLLLKQGADARSANKKKETAFEAAFKNGHEEVLKELLRCKAAYSSGGTPPLHSAAMNGQTAIVMLLLAYVSIEQVWKNCTPLYSACLNGHVNLVKKLLELGSNIDPKDPNSRYQQTVIIPPLHGASFNGRLEIVKLLLRKGAHVDAKDEQGASALHLACLRGHKDVAAELIRAGANPNSVDSADKTPLHMAAEKGLDSIVILLLEKGAEKEASNRKGEKALYLACQNNHEEVVKILLCAKAKVVHYDTNRLYPLHIAAEKGYIKIVQLLLKKNEGFDLENANLETPLYCASKNGHEEVVGLLLEAGADKEVNADREETSLLIAASNGHKKIVKMLLAKRKSIKLSHCNAALYRACQNGHEYVALALIAAGANINVRANYDNNTALHIAAQNGHLKIVKLLLELGSIIEAKNTHEQTALYIACERGHQEIVEALLAAGAEVNVKTPDHQTPLHIASEMGYVKIVRLLLERKANIEAKNQKQETALHLACYSRHVEVIKNLLNAGAKQHIHDSTSGASLNPYNTSRAPQNPLPDAAQKGHNAVVKLLIADRAALNRIDLKNALSNACNSNHVETVRLLLQVEDLNLDTDPSMRGYAYLLHGAVRSNYTALVKVLLENGADKEAKQYDFADDSTPLHEALARAQYHSTASAPVIQLLLAAGVNDSKEKEYIKIIFNPHPMITGTFASLEKIDSIKKIFERVIPATTTFELALCHALLNKLAPEVRYMVIARFINLYGNTKRPYLENYDLLCDRLRNLFIKKAFSNAQRFLNMRVLLNDQMLASNVRDAQKLISTTRILVARLAVRAEPLIAGSVQSSPSYGVMRDDILATDSNDIAYPPCENGKALQTYLIVDIEGAATLVGALVLKALEEKINRRLCELFDCVVASSFGSVLGLSISLGDASLEKLTTALTKQPPLLAQVSEAKSRRQLNSVIKDCFKSAILSSALTRVIIPYLGKKEGRFVPRYFDTSQARKDEKCDLFMKESACVAIARAREYEADKEVNTAPDESYNHNPLQLVVDDVVRERDSLTNKKILYLHFREKDINRVLHENVSSQLGAHYCCITLGSLIPANRKLKELVKDNNSLSRMVERCIERCMPFIHVLSEQSIT